MLLLSYAAYAVLIGLSSSDIAQLGGTGTVSVNCPTASPCKVDRVTWSLSGTPPRVTTVHVTWTPASASPASYTVYVVLYDNSNNAVGSGSATQQGSSQQVITNVPVSPSVDPKDVYKVEIVIVQTAF
ncbi:MAG: hypothetical protein QXW56_06025 [Nitrososphaerota archaeon]